MCFHTSLNEVVSFTPEMSAMQVSVLLTGHLHLERQDLPHTCLAHHNPESVEYIRIIFGH